MPFDQFTVEQLAGDLLPQATNRQRVATGFNRLNMMTREGGAQPKEYLAKYAADRVRTVAGTWLGSTLGCAECHDHKYDPFTTRDFYRMAAFFADIKQWGVYQDYPYTPNPDLKGWTNDHPWPPELEVDIPYLQARLQRLTEQWQTESRTDVNVLEGNAQAFKAYEAWRDQVATFLAQHDSGWLTPTQEVSGEPASAVTLSDIDIGVAAIRLELLEDPARGGRVFHDPEGTPVISCQFQGISAEGKAREIPIHFADANHDLPRYANGFEILGVQSGWQVAVSKDAPEHVATWILEEPLQLSAGERLVVKLSGNQATRVRVSISPVANPVADHLATWGDVVSYILSTPALPERRAVYRELQREIRGCRGGRWPTLVTESATPQVTRVLPRGNWQDETGEIVEPGVPVCLPGVDAPNSRSGSRWSRLDLARWLVSKDQPLTARVQMNRLWKELMGHGICDTLDDFGTQGDWPTHPDLLDWLAVEFRDSGWDFKHMVRLIVSSATYRQSSARSGSARQQDPQGRWLAGQNARRLSAELVRDNALSIAGLICLDRGGPPAMPYQPEGYYEHLQFPDRTYVSDIDDRQWRRGVYMHWQRTFLHPMLANFDAPSREECTGQRVQANTPQQALTLLNDPTFVAAAREFARELPGNPNGADVERIRRAIRRALGRWPRDEELESLQVFLDQQRREFAANPLTAVALSHSP
ncbi:MAG TPA: DUF1553 domain-containing protein, partial [Pirellulaceae bacterium]